MVKRILTASLFVAGIWAVNSSVAVVGVIDAGFAVVAVKRRRVNTRVVTCHKTSPNILVYGAPKQILRK